MPNEQEHNEPVVQNLYDAGCEPELIAQFLELDRAGRTEEQFRLLRSHRTKLLQKVHESQKNLDCLDYLIYTIRKESERT